MARSRRIHFPINLCVHAQTVDDFMFDTCPGALQILTGHAAVYAWYLAMHDALRSPKEPWWISALWQAALTVTFQARTLATHELALASLRLNNDIATAADHLSDTFPAFARKMSVVLNQSGKNISVSQALPLCTEQRCSSRGTW